MASQVAKEDFNYYFSTLTSNKSLILDIFPKKYTKNNAD